MGETRLREIEQSFIDRGGKITKHWGMGEPVGRVFSSLLYSDGPLSQRGIAEMTGYSLSLVSPSLRMLENLKMVRSIRGDGRERLYETTVSFIEALNIMMMDFLEQDVRPVIAELESVMGDIQNKKKLAQLIREYKRLEFYLTMFEKVIVMRKVTEEKVKKLLG